MMGSVYIERLVEDGKILCLNGRFCCSLGLQEYSGDWLDCVW